MDLKLIRKRAVVCGSTQGIGKASALELAALGASVTLVARDEIKLKNTLGELMRSDQQDHDYLIADFDKPDQLNEAILSYPGREEALILINNTGGPPGGQAIDASPDDFVKAFSSHLLCNQILTQALVPSMKKAGYGRIINVVSTSVKIPIHGLGVSNTIRGAVANWAKTLSLELGPFGITVNNVLPGSTKTARMDWLIKSRSEKSGRSQEDIAKEMIAEIPAGRMGEASEVAALIAFLATPAAAYINGTSIPVDGGRTGSL
jgi:3-oxoacyl-[acyl-carrier protein] reductase